MKEFLTKALTKWYRLMMALKIMRLDISMEECPAELCEPGIDEDGNPIMTINLVAEAKWFWQKRAPIPRLGCCGQSE